MPFRLFRGARVGFEHDELGWVEGIAQRANFNGEEWLVRLPWGDRRWVPVGKLRPPRSEAAEGAAPQ